MFQTLGHGAISYLDFQISRSLVLPPIQTSLHPPKRRVYTSADPVRKDGVQVRVHVQAVQVVQALVRLQQCPADKNPSAKISSFSVGFEFNKSSDKRN